MATFHFPPQELFVCLYVQAVCPREPFLQVAPTRDREGAAESEAALLDRQFRLLREDVLHPLREEMAGFGLRALTGNAKQALNK